MERLDFYKLSRPVQERFIGSVKGTGQPAPILFERPAPNEPRAWVAVCVAAVAAFLVLFRVGLGKLGSAMAIQPIGVAVVYVALAALAVFALLRALGVWSAVRSLPFKAGIYMFPIGLVDARRHWIKMYKIEELRAVDGPGPGLAFKLVFDGATYELHARDQAHAEAAKQQLASARGLVVEAIAARDSVRPKAMAALDPLHGVANPLVSSVSITNAPPVWSKLDWLFGLVAGAAIGFAFWAVHNARSDDAMYARAVETNDVASYRAYLARGSRHRAEVANVLLPRAELLEAERTGSVDAIERYIQAHPSTGIAAEIVAALRKAMIGELEEAKRAGTLAALDDFARRHPSHGLDAEVKAARHAVYAAAIAAYEKSAPKDPTALAFVQRLVAFAERKGPKVEVRFHREESKSMEKADAAVGKNRFFNGVVSLPSRYFDAAHAKGREAEMGAAVVARFQQAFAPEILAFSIGPSIDDPEAPLPAVTVPTLFVVHAAEWTGGVATSASPRGVWVGLGFAFSGSFSIPDEPKPRVTKAKIYRSPNPADGKGEDRPEEKIYDAMAKEGFDHFTKKLLGAYFAK